MRARLSLEIAVHHAWRAAAWFWVVCAAQGCIAFGYGETAEIGPGSGQRTDVDSRGNSRDGGADASGSSADAQVTVSDGGPGDAPDAAEAGSPDAAHGEPGMDAGGDALPGPLLDLPHDGELTSICYAPDECNGDDLLCFGAVGTAPGLCTEDCEEDDDCSAVDGLQASCTAGQCLVNCAGTEEAGDGPCPRNMECRALLTESVPGVLTPVVVALSDPNHWCVYPEDAGRNDVPALQRCEPAHGDGDCSGLLTCHDPDGLDGHGYCTETCESADECAPASGASSTPVCFQGACELDCSEPGATCPAGMNCRDTIAGPFGEAYRCLYID